ncbi:MAG: hypothetical protein ACXWZS_04830 [Gemmatirosa sp.]
MATPDKLPAERNQDRPGPQLTAAESRQTDREVTAQPVRADGDELRGRGASGGATQSPPVSADPDAYQMSETAMGGADAIQKTSFGVGHGGEPDGRTEFAPVGLRKGDGPVVARSDAGGGMNPIAWIVGLLAVLAAVVYGAGMLTG